MPFHKTYQSLYNTMTEENVSESKGLFVSSDFDIFAHKPIQTSVLETIETIFKAVAPVEQSDLEFLIPR